MTGEWSYVWAAYLLTWGTLLGYVWFIRSRGREAERDLVEPIQPGAVYRGDDREGGAQLKDMGREQPEGER